MSEPRAQQARQRRQHFGEMPFAVIKVCFALRRFLLRGAPGIRQEWRWACLAFNLKKRMSRIATLRAHRAAPQG